MKTLNIKLLVPIKHVLRCTVLITQHWTQPFLWVRDLPESYSRQN